MHVFILTVLTLVSFYQASQASETTQGPVIPPFSYSLNDEEITVTGFSVAAPNGTSFLSIPSDINGVPVRRIAANAFRYSILAEIIIPNSVTNIGSGAFDNCTSLTNVALSANISKIETLTFNNCVSLTNIILPPNLTSIEDAALCGTGLVNVTIPNGVTNIGSGAFFGLWNLTNIFIPESVAFIGENAFSGPSFREFFVHTNNAFYTSEDGVLYNKTQTALLAFPNNKTNAHFSIPNIVTDLGPSSFFNCTNLFSVTIPTSVTNIGAGAFGSCTNLSSITIPGSVEIIKGSTLSGCSGLTNLLIGTGVKTINSGAFASCTNLKSVIIPDTVSYIGSLAFMGCTALTNVSLPPQLLVYSTTIGTPEEIWGATALNSLVNSLSTNQVFIANLAQAILAASNNYGLATKTALNTSTANLATKTELANSLAESRADGINSVISNPNLWTLYTTNQIKAMVMGDLMLTRTNNGQFVLNYDIEQSDNLTTWAPYQGFSMPLTNLPTDKAFVRIKLKNQQ